MECLSEKLGSRIVHAAAQELKSKYVDPKKGNDVAALLIKYLEKGRYDSFSDPRLFAQRLEKDLWNICQDKHLHVVYRPQFKRENPQEKRIPQTPTLEDNHGFNKVEILSNGVGYLKLDRLSQGKEAESIASAAMKFLSRSRALIIDLRENQGGAAWMVQHICSYLFKEQILLYSLYNRPKNITRKVWTSKKLHGQKFLKSTPVFILISKKTFSGAEGLAYTLKHHKRAVIIGEASRGGAHPIMWIKLGDGFEISIPYIQVIHPVTKTDWEGTGVEPHYEVPADLALKTALELAQKSVTVKK